jgi:hypothetical protein
MRTAPPTTTIGSRIPGRETHKETHGLNGDILVWNSVTKRRHELSSMGIRVNAETLRGQLEMSNLLGNLQFPYHQAIVNNELPALDRRRHRPVPHADAAAAQSAPGRGQRNGMAENPEGDLREEEYFRAGVECAARTPIVRRVSLLKDGSKPSPLFLFEEYDGTWRRAARWLLVAQSSRLVARSSLHHLRAPEIVQMHNAAHVPLGYRRPPAT